MLWQRTLGDESEATKFRRPRRRISSAVGTKNKKYFEVKELKKVYVFLVEL